MLTASTPSLRRGAAWVGALGTALALGFALRKPTTHQLTAPARAPLSPASLAPSGAADVSRAPMPRPQWSAPSLSDAPLPEREYFQQLQELNHSDKRAALTLVEKGEQWYSSTGQLAEARRALRVTLLVDLGQMAEARRLTREYLERYPDSPYSRLVQGVTGIHPRPWGPRVTPSAVSLP